MDAPRPQVWLLLERASIPSHLEPRVIELGLVPLGLEEMNQLFLGPTQGSDEERLAALMQLGLTPTEIARRLHVSRRTVYRRIENLKKRKEQS